MTKGEVKELYRVIAGTILAGVIVVLFMGFVIVRLVHWAWYWGS